jgi:hypothetical protein
MRTKFSSFLLWDLKMYGIREDVSQENTACTFRI